MNLDRFLKHFDQISEAPDAVLRRFILDLAATERDVVNLLTSELRKANERQEGRLRQLIECGSGVRA